jgi:nicotinamidase-related amidase
VIKVLFSDMQRTVAIVVDLQRENYVEGSCPVADYSLVLKNAAKVIKACRTAKIPLIYTKHWLDPKGHDNRAYEPRNQFGAPRGSLAGAHLSEICDEVAPLEDEIIITKQRFSAFYNTRLENILRRYDIRNLVICGVWTEHCLETTVWDAAVRDYRIALVKDACGGSTTISHKAAILNMANWLFGGAILATDEFAKALQGQDFKAWHFRESNEFPYTLESMERMYESL